MRILVLLSFLFCVSSLTAQEIQVEAKQQSLVSKRTATWCPICGDNAWDMFKRLQADLKTDALVIATHHAGNSDLYSPVAKAFVDNYESSFGQPVFFHNTKKMGGGSSAVESEIKASVDTASKATPTAQSGLAVSVNPSTNMLTISTRTEFFSEMEGEFYLGLYLIENVVTNNQADYSGGKSGATHNNVLREALSAETFGELVAEGTIAADAKYEKSWTVAFDDTKYSLDNVTIAAILWQKTPQRYEVVNLSWTDQISTQQVTAVAELEEVRSMRVLPNLVCAQAQLQLELDEPLENARMELFSHWGQPLELLHSGRLQQGEQNFMLNAMDLAAGMYFIRLTAKGGVYTQPFIKQ